MSQLKKCFVRTGVVLALALYGMAQTSPKTRGHETAVRHVVQRVQDEWNAPDGKAFAEPFHADADYVGVNGTHLNGREGIEKGHVGIFNSIYRDSRNKASIKSVRFLRKDVAAVRVEWNLEFTAGGKTQKGRAMNTMVITRRKVFGASQFSRTCRYNLRAGKM